MLDTGLLIWIQLVNYEFNWLTMSSRAKVRLAGVYLQRGFQVLSPTSCVPGSLLEKPLPSPPTTNRTAWGGFVELSEIIYPGMGYKLRVRRSYLKTNIIQTLHLQYIPGSFVFLLNEKLF